MLTPLCKRALEIDVALTYSSGALILCATQQEPRAETEFRSITAHRSARDPPDVREAHPMELPTELAAGGAGLE